jgi:hypothetical protein
LLYAVSRKKRQIFETTTLHRSRKENKMNSSPFMSRFEIWHAKKQEKINFNIRRKEWGRDLLRKLKLTQPEEEATGEFENILFRVWIGPRGGIRIRQIGVLDKPQPPQIENLSIFEALQKVGL